MANDKRPKWSDLNLAEKLSLLLFAGGPVVLMFYSFWSLYGNG